MCAWNALWYIKWTIFNLQSYIIQIWCVYNPCELTKPDKEIFWHIDKSLVWSTYKHVLKRMYRCSLPLCSIAGLQLPQFSSCVYTHCIYYIKWPNILNWRFFDLNVCSITSSTTKPNQFGVVFSPCLHFFSVQGSFISIHNIRRSKWHSDF